MKKFKLFSSLTAEEEWINAVQAQGYRLVGVNPYLAQYEFVPHEGAGPTVRLDFQPDLSGPDYTDYLILFQDAGWAVIPGSKKNHTSYFQMTDQAREDVIFSDEASQKAFKKRYQRYCLSLASVFGVQFLSLQLTYQNSPASYRWDVWPKLDGLTWQGKLWEMFFIFPIKFLFQTPFWSYLIGILGLSCLYLAWKAGRD